MPIEIRPLAGALGAEVLGVDLADLDGATFDRIRAAFLAYGVIFFRDQKLEPEEQIGFARRFGELDLHPIVNATAEHPELVHVLKPAGESASFGTGWHTDNSFFAEPSLGSVLYGLVIPPFGGDTLYASMERAYEALSEPFRERIERLVAVHSASRAYDPKTTGEAKYAGDAPITYRYSEAIYEEVEHPVVRTHPETGRRSLYVNPMFTLRIVGFTRGESEALLGFLYEHCARPDFQCRFRWQQGSLALWDNRCVWHYAMDDYQQFERVMHRVTIRGDKPR
jgi:taurine dioxygenase